MLGGRKPNGKIIALGPIRDRATEVRNSGEKPK